MISAALMKLLIALYVVISAIAFFEGNHPRSLYWLAAALLTLSVLWGTK